MASYEKIPTIKLSKQNKVVVSSSSLPELVHLDDPAKYVFIDFKKIKPAVISSQTPIDIAIHEMKSRQVSMLLVVDDSTVVGIISQEDTISERPLRLMQEKNLTRAEITVDLLMKPQSDIITVEALSLKHAQVGHIVTTIRAHNAPYILVVKKLTANRHLITGLFSAHQVGRQLHSDLSSILIKEAETIIDLHKGRM